MHDGLPCVWERPPGRKVAWKVGNSDGGKRGTGQTGPSEICNQSGLLERLDRGGFVVLHVEDRVKLGDLEQVVDLLGEVEQLQFATLILGGREGADQFADA